MKSSTVLEYELVFHDRLRDLVKGKPLAKQSRDAGLSTNAIANLLNSGASPRVDTALALARSLKVDVGWLIDPLRQDFVKIRRMDSLEKAFMVDAACALVNRVFGECAPGSELNPTLNALLRVEYLQILHEMVSISKRGTIAGTEQAERIHSTYWFFKAKSDLASRPVSLEPPIITDLIDMLRDENDELRDDLLAHVEENERLRELLEENDIDPDSGVPTPLTSSEV